MPRRFLSVLSLAIIATNCAQNHATSPSPVAVSDVPVMQLAGGPSSATSLIGRFEAMDVVVSELLAAPTNLVATVTGTTVSLRWTAAADPAVVNYMIEVGNAPGLANFGRYPSFGTSFEGAAPNGTYYVRVRSVDAQGAESAATNEVTVTVTPSGNPELTFNAPQPPPGVVGVPYFFSFCGLPNDNGANCAGVAAQLFGGVPPYHFQLDTFGGFPPIGLILAPNGALSGIPSGAVTNHSFKVCAVDTTGVNRCPTVTMTIRPRETTCTPPAVPTGLTASANGSIVTVNWTRSSGATSYLLEAGTSAGGSEAFNGDVGDLNSITAPAPVGRFYIRVRAKNACGLSAASAEAPVTVGTSVPPPGGGGPGFWDIEVFSGTGYYLGMSREFRVPDVDSGSFTYQLGRLLYRFNYSGGVFTMEVSNAQADSCLLSLSARGSGPSTPGRTVLWIARGTLTGTYTYSRSCLNPNEPSTQPISQNFQVTARRTSISGLDSAGIVFRRP
jgi:hypothetical protein